ncbi:Sir2 family protein [Brevibacillus centrosporus]|uniref:protein acetyllysine N-acetyltransferase n=1 Tax=Brevibacillus centrosporus TaxID=54910 RepID=A0A1I3WGL2_9BACL|nr:Sir2 family NAD-dependent protein deacetylase [Brevibacillus centrosporus]SFK06540.1 Sir2 family protein [Brevibacillus centrosporus]
MCGVYWGGYVNGKRTARFSVTDWDVARPRSNQAGKHGSQKVAQLHGTLASVRCLRCVREYASSRYLEETGANCECGGFLRPSVVLFGEGLPPFDYERAEEWTEEADLFIVLGSSLLVSPANLFPQRAKQRGARLVIVNRDTTPLDERADMLIQNEPIGSILQRTEKYLNA